MNYQKKKSLHCPFMGGNDQCSFFNKGLYAPNDGLDIEVTIESLVEASLEIEEEQHQFTGL